MSTTTTRPATINTTIHTYLFNVDEKEQAEAYLALCEKLKATPGRGHWMHCYADHDKSEPTPGEITLETKHLFGNQWNSEAREGEENGLRVFDWYEGIYTNRQYKQGHYLDITDEMVAVRQETLSCGYCGAHHETLTDNGMCDRCLGSEYLEPENWHLLRLLPVAETFGGDRAKLSPDEEAEFRARFTDAQSNAKAARLKKQAVLDRKWIDKKLVDAEKTLEQAKESNAVLTWLADNGLNPRSPIHYTHTGVWCWGWSNHNTPSDSEVSALLEVISEFPGGLYEIRTKQGGKYDGKVLNNH